MHDRNRADSWLAAQGVGTDIGGVGRAWYGRTGAAVGRLSLLNRSAALGLAQDVVVCPHRVEVAVPMV
ncbi:hypothetical protein GCM10010232_59640 [Streptomyces amakusaensis]